MGKPVESLGRVERGKILESWKEIASHLRRNVRTCQMWEQKMGLPVHRLDGSPKARVFAYPEELDRWLEEKLHEREPGEAERGARPGLKQGEGRAVLPTLPRWNIGLIAGLAILTVAAAAVSAHLIYHQSQVRWANEAGLPKVEGLVFKEDYSAAYELIQKLQKTIPGNPSLRELFVQATREFSVNTEPQGADVYLRDYTAADTAWTFMGRSPIKATVSRSPKRWKIRKEGFLEVEGAEIIEGTAFVRLALPIKIDAPLYRIGSMPGEMVYVKTGEWKDPNGLPTPGFTPTLRQFGHLGPVQFGDYLLDRYEVTNQQFKAFVDAGGYKNRDYWKNEFIKNGKPIPWEEAIRLFVDKTGRPGPAEWELGDFPEGKEAFPVTGVSWYEAAAYAEFAGKSLPSVFHWDYASGIRSSHLILPLSNFRNEGPLPVGRSRGMGPFGNYDMAGNVREWCWNENEPDGRRFALGGAWGEESYLFYLPTPTPPFSRASNQGFRCLKYLSKEDMRPDILGPIAALPKRDLSREKPVPDDVFNVLKGFYLYPGTSLEAVVESRDESPRNWVREKISFNADYGHERMIAYLFLPRNIPPPYQVVIVSPGGAASYYDRIEDYNASADFVNFIVKSGRAVLYPIFKGTFERRLRLGEKIPWRERTMMFFRDLTKSIDYLETRKDVDASRIGFTAFSWGSFLSPILLSLEHRIKAAILVSGGFSELKDEFGIEQVNFISHVRTPTLMLNGRYDYLAKMPEAVFMFKSLGTAEADKKLVIYDTDHSLPREERIKDTLAWLDKYLGPVKK